MLRVRFFLVSLALILMLPQRDATALVAAPFTNSLGQTFKAVPGTDVLFCVWLTRVMDYRKYAQEEKLELASPTFPQSATHPVVCVSWEDAKAFCAWLTDKEHTRKLLPAKAFYRLPTSREWSLAVGLSPDEADDFQNPNQPLYPWGTTWPPPRFCGNYAPSLKVDSYPYTSPVGSFAANKPGLFDMGGNVWEWCEDNYHDTPNYRVLRGASWHMQNPEDLASTNVIGNKEDLRLDVYGFRTVLDSTCP